MTVTSFFGKIDRIRLENDMVTVLNFIKKEIVLVVSLVLAAVSALYVQPDTAYISYIDFRTLSILLSLMLTMAGLQKLSLFRQIGSFMVYRSHSIRSVILIFILLNFFFSMVITNDVALITFVPFTIVTLNLAGRKDLFIITIVLETIAANLGSMLTPLGNPQNLYLYSLSGMNFFTFLALMLPYSIVALLLLMAGCFFIIRKSPLTGGEPFRKKRTKKEKRLLVMYLLTFLVALLVVLRILPYYAGLLLVVLPVLFFDRSILKKPDYSLLFTFVFLFIFIGNIKRIPQIHQLLSQLIRGHEVEISVLLSQFISNVPCAILCSGFTDKISDLIIGTNLGGLGTLIASMASLISFKQYGFTDKANRGKYLLVFSAANLIFLAVMLLTHCLMGIYSPS